MDVYFQIDVSGSMSAEISSIRNNITTVIDTFTCNPGEDPVTTGCIPDLQTGVGTYGGQLGVDPHLWHLKDINGVNLNAQGADSTQSRLPSAADAWGNEQHLQAMSVATTGACASDATRFARACYRPNALRALCAMVNYSTARPCSSTTHTACSHEAQSRPTVYRIGPPRIGRPPTREGLAERSLTGTPRRGRRGATSCCRSRPPGPFEAAGLTRAVVRPASRAVRERIGRMKASVVNYMYLSPAWFVTVDRERARSRVLPRR